MTESTDIAKHSERALRTHIAGAYLEAERLYRRALTAIQDEANPAYQDILALNVRLLLTMGEHANALKLAQDLLKLKEKHFGFHHPQTATVLRLLSEIKSAQNNPQAAMLDIRRALDIWMDALGWQVPEPDPNDFELHQMAGPRNLLPEFDWINGELDQTAQVARLPEGQQKLRRFNLLLEIAHAFSWLGLHKTSSRLYKAALQLLPDIPPAVVWQSYWAAATATQSLMATGEIDSARQFLQEFLRVLEGEYGDGADVAPLILLNLANLDSKSGRLQEARVNLTRALELLHQIHGETHIQVARVHVLLGDLLAELGEMTNAESHFDKAIAILESWHGSSDTSLVLPFMKKGLMLKQAGQLTRAEKCFTRALEVLLPRDHGDVALAGRLFEELSKVYVKQHSYQQAQMAQLRGLDMLREHGRPTDQALADGEINIASIYLALAKYVDAEKNVASALHVFERHPDKAKLKTQIGLLYLLQSKIEIEQSKLQQASQSLRQAEAAIEALVPEQFELVQQLNVAYADLYNQQGFPSKAIIRLEEVIELDTSSKRNYLSQAMIDALCQLNELEIATGKYANAEFSLIKNVKLAEERCSTISPAVLETASALTRFYVNQKKLTAAEATVDRCGQIAERGEHFRKDPAYAAYLQSYAKFLFARGEFESATEKLKRALSVIENCFGSLHPRCASLWIEISANLLERGIEDQADEAAHKAVTICSNIFDWNHYLTMRAVANEAYISIRRERLDVGMTLAERLFPALGAVKVPPELMLAKSLSQILKNEANGQRTRTVTAIQEYLSKHAKALVFSYNEDAIDLLLDLTAYSISNRLTVNATICDTIIDYLLKSDSLVRDPNAVLHRIMANGRAYGLTDVQNEKIKRHLP